MSGDLREDMNLIRREGFLIENGNETAIEKTPMSTIFDLEFTNGDWSGNTVGFFLMKSKVH